MERADGLGKVDKMGVVQMERFDYRKSISGNCYQKLN